MSKFDKIEDVLGKLYDRFIMRDLAHILAGAFALVILSYSLNQCPILFGFISRRPLTFLIFLFFSYFFGLLAQEIPALLSSKKWSRVDDSDHNIDFPRIVKKIEEKYGSEPMRLIERFEYLRRFGSSLCATSGISFAFVIYKWLFRSFELVDLPIVIGIVFVFISSLRLFKRMKARIEDAKQYYLNKLGDKVNNLLPDSVLALLVAKCLVIP